MSPQPQPSSPVAYPAAGPDTYLAVARAIAARLARTAVWDGPRCTWVGRAVEAVQGTFQLVQRAQGADLYGGTAGIALFLALLLEQRPDEVLLETLEGAVNHLLADTGVRDGSANYAYYAGALGVAHTLVELGERLGRPDWAEAGWQRVAQVCAQPVQAFEVDVISGVAGAIPVLLRLLAKRPAPYLHEAARRCGDFLVQHAVKQPDCWRWEAAGQPALTGYSHGAAGIALALLELYRATENPAYYTAAMMGFNFERLHFSPQLQNWPDLREQPTAGPPSYGEAWCHGAPGIALSRLRAWQLTGEESFRQEAEMALATTHRSLYTALNSPNASANFSLCHGLAGNADIMLQGSQILKNTLYFQVAEAVGHYGLERYHRTGLYWPSGVHDPAHVATPPGEAPGLLLGLAGTGYFYLRLAFPDKIASVLLP